MKYKQPNIYLTCWLQLHNNNNNKQDFAQQLRKVCFIKIIVVSIIFVAMGTLRKTRIIIE